MTTTKRILLGVLALLVGLPLLLMGTWWALNVRDVPAQPWPQRLALPSNTVPEAENLLLLLEKAPALKQPVMGLGDCKDGDCLPAWRERLPMFAAQREANPAFMEVCEQLTARDTLRVEDPLPAELSLSFPLPRFSPLSSCHQALLALALSASDAGNAPQALRWLQQADRLDRAAMAGGRTLVAHMIAVNLAGQKLTVIRGVAERHTDLRTALLPLAEVDGNALLAKQREWMVVEANFMRVVNDSLRHEDACPESAPLQGLDRLLCKVQARGYQPEYTEQLMRDHWLRGLDGLDAAQDLPRALPTLRTALSGPSQTTLWHRVRHTVAHILHDVARPAWAGYLERAADLQLAAEATQLWLRQAPLTDASPALRERLKGDAAGGWQLGPFSDPSRGRLPLRWPAPT